MQLCGKVRLGVKTKNLVKSLVPGEIAIINHQDIDYLAAQSLLEAGVKAVINVSASISGKYPNLGPQRILAAGIPIIDQVEGNLFQLLKNGDQIKIIDGKIINSEQIIASGEVLTYEKAQVKLNKTRDNLENELSKFIDNTLDYAKKEKRLILDLEIPSIDTNLEDRDVLIVVRGKDYRQDLEAVSSYIKQIKPILIGVDGGADALLEYGFQPDIIIGDMDSVSDKALKSDTELIVHAYPDGTAPGMKRIKKLNLQAQRIPAPGTSEDIAMLLAYEKGAELIVAVGTHTHMIDFLEKGRPGMASTFLVRLKVGNKLVDAKGVNKLYNTRLQPKHFAQLIIASLIPIIVIMIVSPPINQLLELLIIKLKFSLGF
ncbi:putative membrane-anchored protein [Halobacteroides halobius DSM 5150]|uniref:Putative membrane-anchored protein n=1 Tax=Halobacteroides halobius (strain ATCC 35273 / DSM 5150 / MD-1) TaxID=748449 RepID=L0K8U8_HALHC|nr:putative cytokinetic ring protein SteA [Halobacteroides halobius]AGB40543.1 putative membrane-anchored protein [Halobacteroides halobius DSM 5150]